MPKFRTKIVEIEARQFLGNHVDGNVHDIIQWVLAGDGNARWWEHREEIRASNGEFVQMLDPEHLTIRTLEGDMRADLGDWIICGLAGEFYPCKPEIFNMKYEPAAD